MAGEVLVNLGGEPDRDDSGLPPVDIVVPDDARELERDVQAYYREQRALRRRLRRSRWASPLTRDGMIVPLLAGCLILALIAGTLLTVFTAWPGGISRPRTPAGRARPAGSASTTPQRRATAGGPAAGPAGGTAVTAAGPLPDLVLTAGRGKLPVRELKSSVLALVPAGCACAAAVRTLAGQAAAARVRVYLIGSTKAMPTVRSLAGQAAPVQVRTAEDARNVLGTAYKRAGLTAVLVDAAGRVRLARDLGRGLQLTSALAALSAAGPSAAPSPAG